MTRAFIPQSASARASLFMVLAMVTFVSNDTCVKLIGTSLPMGELICLRGGLSALFITGIAAHQGVLGEIGGAVDRRVLARTAIDFISTLAFIAALLHMKIANLTAIMQAVPLAVAFLSRALLGEQVGGRRALAIAAGFAGMLLIVRPSPTDFTIYDALALFIVFAIAARDLVTRTLPARIPSTIVALANAGFVCVGGFLLGLTQGFVMPAPWQLGLIFLAAAFVSCGYLLMVLTMRLAPPAVTAPFRYTILLMAIFYGIVIFGEYPDRLAALGMVMIVTAGLYAARLTYNDRKPAP